MKIIIPIASYDPEIVKVYGTIKPLIKIGNSTLIELFVKNFKFQDEYVFLCRQKDLVETKLLDVLNKLKIKKKIISIKKNTSSTLETIEYAKTFCDIFERISLKNFSCFKNNYIYTCKKNVNKIECPLTARGTGQGKFFFSDLLPK